MMELFSEKSQCCGCMACADICPKNTIAVKVDSEGFWYPEIKRDLCVNCGLCKTVCPFASGKPGKAPRRYIAARQRIRRCAKSARPGPCSPY